MKSYNIDGASLTRAKMIKELQRDLVRNQKPTASEFVAWVFFSMCFLTALFASVFYV